MSLCRYIGFVQTIRHWIKDGISGNKRHEQAKTCWQSIVLSESPICQMPEPSVDVFLLPCAGVTKLTGGGSNNSGN
jgi:hypothetical protein